MSTPVPKTLGESLFWSYANLAMMTNVLDDGVAHPDKKHFMIRSRLYAGLRDGSMHVRGFFDDEKLKLKLPKACWYCGSREKLSADHIVPQKAGGSDTGENLIYSCRHCNSSKGSKDLLEWLNKKQQFPPLFLLRRYLKMAIEHCEKRKLLGLSLPEAKSLEPPLPFALGLIPHQFPSANELSKWVPPSSADIHRLQSSKEKRKG